MCAYCATSTSIKHFDMYGITGKSGAKLKSHTNKRLNINKNLISLLPTYSVRLKANRAHTFFFLWISIN